ncbi:MAG: transporter substrate-binding domain-containing protein [Deltaproteobacteria bacterium]|nr:transporter substrate-binding domain-containing protein [Deltaproteobacteria bacterium]
MKKSLVFLVLLFCALAPDPVEASLTKTPSALNKPLIVGVTNDPPYTFKLENGQWVGLNVDIWAYAAHTLLLQYEIREFTLSDLLPAIQQGKVDVSIARLRLTPERAMIFNFSIPIGFTPIALATLPEKASSPWWTALRLFISWQILKYFVLMVGILVFVGFLMWLIERQSNPEQFGGSIKKGVAAGIYWVGSTLASGVCIGIKLKSLPGRIFGLLWMFICVIALSAFIASLAASLTIRNIMTISMVDESAFKNMHLGAITSGAGEQILKARGGKYSLYATPQEAMEAVIRKDIEGFIYDEVTLNYFAEKEYKDKVAIQRTNLRGNQYAFLFPAKSPLLPPVNSAILKAMSGPDWEMILKRYGMGEDFEQKQTFRRGKVRN